MIYRLVVFLCTKLEYVMYPLLCQLPVFIFHKILDKTIGVPIGVPVGVPFWCALLVYPFGVPIFVYDHNSNIILFDLTKYSKKTIVVLYSLPNFNCIYTTYISYVLFFKVCIIFRCSIQTISVHMNLRHRL